MKDFYYLHLSKASGRFFRRYVLDDLIVLTRHADNNMKYLWPETPVDDWTHHGWHDLISENTYLICSLRDPVEVIISYLMHHGGINNKNDFFSRVRLNDNIQSKGFIRWEDNMVNPEAKVDFNKDLILSRLNRVNLVLDSKDINIKNYNKIREKIAFDLSIPFELDIKKEDTLEFKTPGVQEFYDSLTDEEISFIKEINYMDVELYEAAKSLFYPI
jgi:hypothetical protein